MELLAMFREKGMAAVTEATRAILAKHDDLPLVVLCGHWAMRAYTRLSQLGKVLEVRRGETVPQTLYALAAHDGAAAAMAIANNSAEGVAVRIVGDKREGSVTVTCITGEQKPLAPAKAETERRESFDGSLTLTLPAFGTALVEFEAPSITR